MKSLIKNISTQLFDIICDNPINIALNINGCEYSYADMGKISLRISAWLKNQCFQHILLYGNKNIHIYQALWGSILSEIPYTPLNPEESALNTYIIKQFNSSIIFTTQQFLNNLLNIINYSSFKGTIIVMDKEYNIENILGFSAFINIQPLNVKPLGKDNTIVYLLFTSGSTGKPKGVPISAKNLRIYLNNMIKVFNFNVLDNFSHASELTFDLSVQEIYIPWVIGAKVTVINNQDFYNLEQALKNKRITIWSSVPSLIKWLLKRKTTYDKLKIAIFIGEALYKEDCKALQQIFPNCEIYNMYGPTEATVACTYYHYKYENHEQIPVIVPIGTIFNDHDFIIIDEESKEINTGELCLQGNQVFNGYYNNEAKNNEVFITIKSKNGWWYRTGDIVSKNYMQEVVYVGRSDQQIKIAGVRVAKHALEANIKDITKATHVIVLGYPFDYDTTKHYTAIIACLELKSNIKEKDILNLLQKNLPSYIKIFSVFLTTFPINRNGKIDQLKIKDLVKNKYVIY